MNLYTLNTSLKITRLYEFYSSNILIYAIQWDCTNRLTFITASCYTLHIRPEGWLYHSSAAWYRLSTIAIEDNMRRFLFDSSRNRFDVTSRKMQISKVFDCYEDDFKQDHQRFTSAKTTLAKYADQLANGSAEVHQRIVRGDYQVIFLEYDWRLNDARD